MSVTFSGKFKQITGAKAANQPAAPGNNELPADGLVLQFSSLVGTSLTGNSVDTWTDSISSVVLTGTLSNPTFISDDNSIQFSRGGNHYALFETSPTFRTIAAVMKFNDSLGPSGNNQNFIFCRTGSQTDDTRTFQCSDTMLSDNNTANVFTTAPVYINGVYNNIAQNVSRSLLNDYVTIVVVLTGNFNAYNNIGAAASVRGFGGNIKELITWDKALTGQEVSDTSSYLVNKWNI